MPELPNRDALEIDFSRDLSRRLQREVPQVLTELGVDVDVANLSSEFWQGIEAERLSVVRPHIEKIYMESVQAMLDAQPIGIDWGVANTGAAEWASNYSYTMVSGITDTTRDLLQKKVAQFHTESGMTLGDLKKELQTAFGPVRAEMIAVTETTRAAVQGQLAFVEEIERDLGTRLIPFWQTNRDDLVCPICGPKDGQQITDGEYPPAHPRCRCWVNHEVPS